MNDFVDKQEKCILFASSKELCQILYVCDGALDKYNM